MARIAHRSAFKMVQKRRKSHLWKMCSCWVCTCVCECVREKERKRSHWQQSSKCNVQLKSGFLAAAAAAATGAVVIVVAEIETGAEQYFFFKCVLVDEWSQIKFMILNEMKFSTISHCKQASKQAKSRGIILITIAINAKVIVVNTRRHREKEKNNKIIKNGKCDKISKEKYLKHAGYSANTNYFRLFVCLCVFWKQTNSDHKQTNKELSWPVLLFHCLLCSPLVVDLTSKTNVLSEMYFMLGVVCQIQLFITHTERWKQRDGGKSAK